MIDTEKIQTLWAGITDQYKFIAKDINEHGQDSKEIVLQRLDKIKIRIDLLEGEILKAYDN